MARKITRKSNKTSHVLNLLTSDPKRSEPAVEPSVDPAFEPDPAPEDAFTPPVSQAEPAPSSTEADTPAEPIFPEFDEPEPTPAAPARRRTPPRKAAAPAANSSTMMDLSQALEERISQQVHDSLSAKLAEYEAQDAKRLEEERKRAERIAAQVGLSLDPTPEEAPAEDPAPQEQDAPDAAAEPETPPASKPHTEEDFEIVNVMDVMLDGFQQEFMDKFGMCTCRRCWLDTRALTLSSVPAKYVVLTHDTVDAMMNFYEHRYRGMLMAQLTQSCMKVMQNPHH